MDECKIHLIYEPWPEAELLGRHVRLPDWAGYGHVYCILEDHQDYATLKDIPAVAAQAVQGGQGKDAERNAENNAGKSGVIGALRNFFYDALKLSRLTIETDENIIYVADEHTQVASFRISSEDYARAKAHFAAQDGQLVPYDRLYRNCVHNAAKDLRAAGVDLGSGFGYTAGRFFKRAQTASDGNLLYSPCVIEVVERISVKAPPSPSQG